MTEFLASKMRTLKFGVNQGVAVCVCVALLWGASEAVQWIAREIVIPTRDRFFTHLQRVENTLEKQEAATRAIERDTERHFDITKQNGLALEKAVNNTAATNESIRELSSVMRQIRDANTVPSAANNGAAKHPDGVLGNKSG